MNSSRLIYKVLRARIVATIVVVVVVAISISIAAVIDVGVDAAVAAVAWVQVIPLDEIGMRARILLIFGKIGGQDRLRRNGCCC